MREPSKEATPTLQVKSDGNFSGVVTVLMSMLGPPQETLPSGTHRIYWLIRCKVELVMRVTPCFWPWTPVALTLLTIRNRERSDSV